MDPEKSNFEQLEGIEVSHEKSELTLEQKKKHLEKCGPK